MELLAPAGNLLSLKAAVAGGATAVYLAAEKYGARAGAGFDNPSLQEAVEFAHLRGVKVYVTVNTLMKDSELPDAVAVVAYAQKAGVDAFIVQDLGFIKRLKEEVPNAVLHASTQMGICNADGAAFAKAMGLSRVVLARESLPQDIRKIKQAVGIEIEFFAHGALCVSYSGNCYYSSLVSGCSGNRGKCLQLCRKKYTVENESGYWLSAKDICLTEKIAELQQWGVDSLKIEGRLRTPEYVFETVSVYRAAIDGQPDAKARERLQKVFNRGNYCTAYLSAPTENTVYPKAQNHIGFPCGTVQTVNRRKALLYTNIPLQIGDGVKYLRNGYEVGGGTITGEQTTDFGGSVQSGDTVCLTSQAGLKQQVAQLDTAISVSGIIRLEKERHPILTLTCGNTSVSVTGQEAVMLAVKQPLIDADVREAIGMLGGTPFRLNNLTVYCEHNCFYPVSRIKELRKSAVTALKTELLRQHKRPIANNGASFSVNRYSIKQNSVFIQIPVADGCKKIAFSYDYVVLNPDNYADYSFIREECEKLHGNVFLNLPFIVRGDDAQILARLRDLPVMGYIVNNVAQFHTFADKPILDGIGVNRLNRQFGQLYIASIESDTIGNGVCYAYGKPPLMHFAHCPKKTHGGSCKNCNGYNIRIQDEKGATFRFRRIKENYCYGILIPDIPVNIVSAAKGHAMLLDFTYADDCELQAVNQFFTKGAVYTLPYTCANLNRNLQ